MKDPQRLVAEAGATTTAPAGAPRGAGAENAAGGPPPLPPSPSPSASPSTSPPPPPPPSKIALKLLDTSPEKDKRRTASALAIGGGDLIPKSDIMNPIMREVDELYLRLLDCMRKAGQRGRQQCRCLDAFLSKANEKALVGEGLIDSLSKDLGTERQKIARLVLETDFYKSMVERIRTGYWKEKEDPVENAEAYYSIASLFGVRNALALLRADGIPIKGTDIIYDYCRFARMHPQVKEMVRKKELSYSSALVFSQLDAERQLAFATKFKGMSYGQIRKQLALAGPVMSKNDMVRLGIAEE